VNETLVNDVANILISSKTFSEFKEKIESLECSTCRGLGQCDDAHPYDMMCNTWECPDCKGTGFK
jgi:DnaJ-class molecular chaperone